MAEPRPIVIVTRPAAGGATFADALGGAALGARVLLSPLLRIEQIAVAPPEPAPRALVLTSARALPAAVAMVLPGGTPVWCVGGETARRAAEAGFDPRCAAPNADALVETILSSEAAGPMLHLRGEVSRGAVADRLTAAGRPCGEVVCYRQVALALSAEARAALGGEIPVVLPLFSPRTGSIFMKQGPFSAPLHIVAMSAAVAEAVAGAGAARLTVAPEPTRAAMIAATAKEIRAIGPASA